MVKRILIAESSVKHCKYCDGLFMWHIKPHYTQQEFIHTRGAGAFYMCHVDKIGICKKNPSAVEYYKTVGKQHKCVKHNT